MYCYNCGKEIDDTKCVCSHCGAAVIRVHDPDIKSRFAAGVLGIFLGGIGLHNFYLGYNIRGLIQLLLMTAGWAIHFFGFGDHYFLPLLASVWGLIEGILILMGKIRRDAKGNLLRD